MIGSTRWFSPGNLVDAIPHINMLFRFCRRYVEHCNGEQNSDMRKNGELRWLKEIAPKCRTVFDVGANVGDWTAMTLSINPSLKVHCFEPCSISFNRLQERGLSGGRLNNYGLSDSPGEATVFSFGEDAGTNSLYKREGLNANQEQKEMVRLDTLDNYCEENGIQEIDLLKLDVEGHELSVLRGSLRMLSAGKIKHIQFEYGGTYIDARILLKDMFVFLQSFQYHLYKIYPKELRHIERYEQRFENFQYSNWVATR
jgi:FkbM family methyltransferase